MFFFRCYPSVSNSVYTTRIQESLQVDNIEFVIHWYIYWQRPYFVLHITVCLITVLYSCHLFLLLENDIFCVYFIFIFDLSYMKMWDIFISYLYVDFSVRLNALVMFVFDLVLVSSMRCVSRDTLIFTAPLVLKFLIT